MAVRLIPMSIAMTQCACFCAYLCVRCLCLACAVTAEHIRLKLQQHDLLRIYPNLEVGA